MPAFTKYVANPLVLILLISTGALYLAGKFWAGYRVSLEKTAQFALSPERVTLRPSPPTWLPQDFSDRLLNSLQLSEKSLLDPDLVGHVVREMEQQAWIDHVRSVQKTPSSLQIDVDYGSPLLIELPERRLLPVDPRGQPFDLAGFKIQATDPFFRVAIQGLTDVFAPGPDPKVSQAAALARVLGPYRQAGGLAGIYGHASHLPSHRPDPQQEINASLEFRLWTAGRNEIVWGSPVGSEKSGEAAWRTKLAGLHQFTQQHGPVDAWPGLPAKRGNVLDLRQGTLMLLEQTRQAYQPQEGTR